MSFNVQCNSAQEMSLGPQLEGLNYWITKTFQLSAITCETNLKDEVIKRVQHQFLEIKMFGS